jgi:hypothetical protein
MYREKGFTLVIDDVKYIKPVEALASFRDAGWLCSAPLGYSVESHT